MLVTDGKLHFRPGEPKCVAVVGCDEETSETLTLVLEILGWTVVTAPPAKDEHNLGVRLVFAGDAGSAELPPYLADESVTVVRVSAVPSASSVDGTCCIKILNLPVDVAEVERVIIEAS